MKITRRNVLFRLAYGHPLVDEKNIPEKTTLCKLFLRSLLGLIAWPIEIVSIVVFVVIFKFSAFFFAGHWMHSKKDENGAIFKPIWKLDKFPPIAWLILSWVAYVIYITCNLGLYVSPSDTLAEQAAKYTMRVSIAGMLAITFIFLFIFLGTILTDKEFIRSKIRESNVLSLICTFIKARKQKYCPIIEIEPEQDRLD